jgi:hypothetical protein
MPCPLWGSVTVTIGKNYFANDNLKMFNPTTQKKILRIYLFTLGFVLAFKIKE